MEHRPRKKYLKKQYNNLIICWQKSQFIQEDWIGYKSQQLTELGARQSQILGKWTRNLYQASMEHNICDSEKLNLIFSSQENQIESGLNFVKGLCQENYEEILTKVQQFSIKYLKKNYQVIQKNIANKPKKPNEINLTQIEDEKMQVNFSNFNDLQQITQFIQWQNDNELNYLNYNLNACPQMRKQQQIVFNSLPFQYLLNQYKNKIEYQSILKKFQSFENDEQNLMNIKNAWSTYKSYGIHAKTQEFQFTVEELNILKKISELVSYYLQNGNQLQRSLQSSLILINLRNSIQSLSDKKNYNQTYIQEQIPINNDDELTIYSGSDDMISNLLITFLSHRELQEIYESPKFASQLSFEIILTQQNEIEIIIRYNQKVYLLIELHTYMLYFQRLKHTSKCGFSYSDQICGYMELLDLLDKQIINDFQQVCQNL